MEEINALCSHCNGYKECIRETDVPPPHIAKITCRCGNWWWEKKDKTKKSKRKIAPLLLDIDYCYSCLRHRSQLPDNVTLEEHHILPYHLFPEYDNDIRNRQMLCTRCHRIVEDVRKIIVDYINLNTTEYNLSEMFKQYESSKL